MTTDRLSTCGICAGTIRRTPVGWKHTALLPSTRPHTPDPDDSFVSGLDDDDLDEDGAA